MYSTIFCSFVRYQLEKRAGFVAIQDRDSRFSEIEKTRNELTRVCNVRALIIKESSLLRYTDTKDN